MPLRARLVLCFALSAALAVAHRADAQDKTDGAQARAAAVENLKKVKIDKPTVTESENFVVAGTMPEEKAKALAAVLERAYAVGRKGAQLGEKDFAWKGKLVVYYLPDAGEFKRLMRTVFQEQADGAYANFKLEPPALVDPADAPGKPTEADLYFNTAARVCGELVRAKGTGTQEVPGWLRDGFGRASAMRAEGTTAKRYAAYKSAARAAVQRGAKLDDVLSGTKTPAGDVPATSFAEFLAYGPRAADFGKLIDALRPSDENPTPTVQAQGFAALGWKDAAAAEAAWKRWVQTGK